MIRKSVAALAAASAIWAAPAAAQDHGPAMAFTGGPAAFAGVTVRLPLGDSRAARPQVRLQLTSYRPGPAALGSGRKFNPAGIELGLAGNGKPVLLAGGRDAREATRKTGIGTTTWLIIGGVLVAVIVIAAAAGSGMGDTCPEIDGSRDHCIDP